MREGEERKRLGLSNLWSLQGLENNLSSSLFQPNCKPTCIQECLFISLWNGQFLPKQLPSLWPSVERTVKWIHGVMLLPTVPPERCWLHDLMLSDFTQCHCFFWEKKAWEWCIPETTYLSISPRESPARWGSRLGRAQAGWWKRTLEEWEWKSACNQKG